MAAMAAPVDEVWRDEARARDLPVRVREPEGTACGAVVYSHGLGGSRDGGGAWGEAWAAAGLLVVHLQHPGSDEALWKGGPGALAGGGTPTQFRARVADVAFALDEIARRRPSQWPDMPDRVGVAGHSFGARTTQVLAGEALPAAVGAPPADPRPLAFVALSPGVEGPGDPQTRFATLTRPFLAVTGSLDGDPLGRGTTPARRASLFDLLPPGRRALLWLQGADHLTFAGTAGLSLPRATGAAALEATHHALVARITTDWWRAWLCDDAEAGSRLAAPAGLGSSDRWSR